MPHGVSIRLIGALTIPGAVLELRHEQQDMVGTGSGDGIVGRVRQNVHKDNDHLLARDGRRIAEDIEDDG